MNVFSRIYQGNEWNGIETRSGPGSHREPTRRVADAIVQLVDWLGVKSFIDFGCGEGNWFPDLPDVSYIGYDPTPDAIDEAQRRHPERDYRVYVPGDVLPVVDLVLCRDVIQHLPFKGGLYVLGVLNDSGCKNLLTSTYIGTENVNIKWGEAYSPNLYAPPFDLRPADLLIHDGYEYHDGDRLRDPAKMLGLWRL